jgi:hypothetical protein
MKMAIVSNNKAPLVFQLFQPHGEERGQRPRVSNQDLVG